MGSGRYLAIFALLLHYHQIKAITQITFKVENYANPSDRDAIGTRCDMWHYFGDHCDPLFKFEAHITFASGETRKVSETAGPFNNVKKIADVLKSQIMWNSFPQKIEIAMKIEDYDLTINDEIARVHEVRRYDKPSSIRYVMDHPLHFEVLVEVNCVENYYGDQCDAFCQPKDGHWRCDTRTGDRICTMPCEHGECKLLFKDAVCICEDNWTGKFCQTKARLTGRSLLEVWTDVNMDIKKSVETVEDIKNERRRSNSALTTDEDNDPVNGMPTASEDEFEISASAITGF